MENIVRFVTSNDRVGAEDGILARDTPASCSSRAGGSPRPVSCWLEPRSPDRETALFQTGRTQPGLGRLACGRASDGLKDADKEMAPASGTLRPQQAGSRDGSGAPSPKNLPDKSWVCAQARPMRKAFRSGYKANQPSIRPTRKASSPCSKPNQLLRLTASALIRVRAWPGGGRRMDTRESAPAVRNHGPTGDDTMQMATTLRRSTHTFLTHLFGPGLDDDRYVIERFQSKADGEIRPRGRNGSSKKGRGKASREIVSLSTVQRMRPERDEIIICTGVNRTTLGVQYWGDRAVGLFVDAKYR